MILCCATPAGSYWALSFENDGGGAFSVQEGATSGGLAKGQQAIIKLRCAPTELGWRDGVMLITTDVPGKETLRFPVSCKMINDPSNPTAWRNQPPGPVSAGAAQPGASTSTQVQLGNQGVNPMNATINMKDATADTIKFTAAPGSVSAANANGPQVDVTIPQNGTVNIDITCTPPGPGLYVNTLEIATNDPVEPQLSYDISCEGAFPPDPEPIKAVALHSDLPAHLVMGLAISPDDKQIAAGYWDGAGLILYGIGDPVNGSLSKQGTFSQPDMNVVTGIRFSADGKNLYYSSNTGDGVGVASRAADGTLTSQQTITRTTPYICGFINTNPPLPHFCPINGMDGARALDISPDDQNLYVTGISDNTLTVLRRNLDTGQLSFSQKFTDTIDGSQIMAAPFGVIVSPDGRNVYVAGRGSNAVIAFTRDPNSGRLTYLTHVVDEVDGVTGRPVRWSWAISPDGHFLYALGYDDGAVQIFKRNPADGYLTPVEAVNVGAGPYHLITSNDPEGSRLLVALWTGDAIKSYRRDLLTGQLTLLGDPAGEVLDGPVFLVSSADDQHVYASLFEGKGVEHLRSQRHAPLAQNLSPASVPVGAGDVTLTVNGERFYAQSTVLLNGAPAATEFVNPRQLRATVPAAQLAGVGTINVTVHTDAPGGGDAAALPLAVIDANAVPIPAVSSLSPPEITLSGQPLNVVINGSGFTAQSQALLNGAPVATFFISPTMLLVQLSATDVSAPGPLAITVVNAPAVNAADLAASSLADTASAPVKFTVAAADAPARPAIGSFAPASINAGSGEQQISVLGYNFAAQPDAATVLLWNGALRETTVLDAQHLVAHLLAADVANPGAAQVTL
ncbi:MAG: beta-propeller fold lactonase family protein, partial [Caldilineaceae bacterium]